MTHTALSIRSCNNRKVTLYVDQKKQCQKTGDVNDDGTDDDDDDSDDDDDGYDEDI